MNSEIAIDNAIVEWVKSIDRPGATLAVFDADKYTIDRASHALICCLLRCSRHVKIRLGGNGYRTAQTELGAILRRKGEFSERFEFFLGGWDLHCFPEDVDFRGMGITCHDVAKLGIEPESDFGRYVDRYDIRGSVIGYSKARGMVTVYERGFYNCGGSVSQCIVVPSSPISTDDSSEKPLPSLSDGTIVVRNERANGLTGAMSTLFLRGEVSGFIEEGKFIPFNNSDKGRWAIGDVVMVKGYGHIPSATHVLAPANMLNFTDSRRRMFLDSGIPVQYVSGLDNRSSSRGIHLVDMLKGDAS